MPFAHRIRIGRWPRRLAALSCLLLAAVSATRRPDSAAATAASRSVLTVGQRAVPVTVQGDPGSYLSPGDVVELLAPPPPGADSGPAADASASPVATAARVLSMRKVDDLSVTASGSWQLVVAVDEATARRLAAHSSQALLAVTGKFP